MDNLVPIIIFIFLPIALSLLSYGALIYAIRYIKRRGFLTEKSERILRNFVALFAILDLVASLISSLISRLPLSFFPFFDFSNLLVAPLYFLQRMLPTMVALWLVFQVLPFSPKTTEVDLEVENASTLKQAVEKILNSESFLTALRTTLPKGEKDAEHGLDYIPYMLHNIEDRRKHFEKSSRTFLQTTVFIGIILSAVVVFFGYVLLNEEAAGTPRTLAQINTETAQISRDINLLLPAYYDNATFKEIIGKSIADLESTKTSEPNQNIAERVKVLISELRETGDIVAFSNQLKETKNNFTSQDDNDKGYHKALEDLNFRLSLFLDKQQAAIPNLKASLGKLNNLMIDVNESLGKSEAQTAEVLKRLGLSLIVSSFFLALLRYAASLYRNNYQEMLRAQQDDLAVRRFYVAYKGAESDISTRGQIISKFINAPVSVEGNSESSLDISKDDVSTIIKELLTLLTKKS
ncbi:MAG: hypothetical protein KME15_17675 [Drouetiella hepatica Uher 2000/2452]|uniref:Uncharacterized protein n=1 Tax=Drouetiella hepatica Uher 2000/2452 TaxID=904376 RepID=A0A951QEL6_9CYAN|nr:hypothetical protein [Drouetiella hepatica Uher 2000/2452]